MLIALAFSWLANDIAAAHQFEDGVVERTVAVRLRDGRGDIEYAIGLNDATLTRFMDTWPDDRQLIEAFEKSGESSSHGLAKDEATARSADARQAEAAEGTLANELQLIRRFAKIATPHLHANLSVLADGQTLPLALVTAEPSSRHHATLIVRWQFMLPDTATTQLTVRDANFLRQPGGAKYAFKTAGEAMLVRSNVAPILVRSDRTVLDSVPAWTRWQTPVIQATIRRLRQPVDAGKRSRAPAADRGTAN